MSFEFKRPVDRLSSPGKSRVKREIRGYGRPSAVVTHRRQRVAEWPASTHPSFPASATHRCRRRVDTPGYPSVAPFGGSFFVSSSPGLLTPRAKHLSRLRRSTANVIRIDGNRLRRSPENSFGVALRSLRRSTAANRSLALHTVRCSVRAAERRQMVSLGREPQDPRTSNKRSP